MTTPEASAAAAAAASGGDKKKAHPPWTAPTGGERTGLHVYNSLTSSKAEFVSTSGRQVTWYMCGPTVYDSAHMGHARNYVSFDILRRIMRDYLHYDVTLVMNITDIDDKIIIRSRERQQSFVELARFYEDEFMEDMRRLGVEQPDVLTRVSEYVPEIVRFVEKIVANGFAYESNGSVYFDTVAFGASHDYAKLEPWSVGDQKLVADGEGALGAASVGASDKRSGNDFALWKKSKEGEPRWPSPWGEGRPGWHIECSAMAGDVLGSNMDIHSGGVDLRFPHHDNELAQSEAHYGCRQWVNYFLHSGHLNIRGQKMSKSLKNFIKIREALEQYSARQIRLFFLQHRYDAPLDFTSESMDQALICEKIFAEFFHRVKDVIKSAEAAASAAATAAAAANAGASAAPASSSSSSSSSSSTASTAPPAAARTLERWEAHDKALWQHLVAAREAVRAALLDNFDTPRAIVALQELVSRGNAYIGATAATPGATRVYLLRSVSGYISEMFRVFGLLPRGSDVGIAGAVGGGEGEGGVPLEALANAVSAFRDRIRTAIAAPDNKKDLFRICDEMRDNVLPEFGIVIDDKLAKGGAAIVKVVDPEDLRKQRAAEKAALEERQRKKQEEEAKKAMPPADMFRALVDKYSQFDDKGVPTHDAKGELLTPGKMESLRKEQAKQAKIHEAWLKQQAQKKPAP